MERATPSRRAHGVVQTLLPQLCGRLYASALEPVEIQGNSIHQYCAFVQAKNKKSIKV